MWKKEVWSHNINIHVHILLSCCLFWLSNSGTVWDVRLQSVSQVSLSITNYHLSGSPHPVTFVRCMQTHTHTLTHTCFHAGTELWTSELLAPLGDCHPTLLVFPSHYAPLTSLISQSSFVLPEYETEVMLPCRDGKSVRGKILSHLLLLLFSVWVTLALGSVDVILSNKKLNYSIVSVVLHLLTFCTVPHFSGEVVRRTITQGSFLCFLSTDWSGGQSGSFSSQIERKQSH